MNEIIILVCGFGRCGSSLVMQMLKAAGISVDGVPPYYETMFGYDGKWIAQQTGRAVKILEPHRHDRNFEPGNYVCIWIDRDLKEQAKSHVQFHREKKKLVVMNPRYSRRELIKFFKKERKEGVRACESLGPTLYLKFEDLIKDSIGSAALIGYHCGIPAEKVLIMDRVVVPRETKCRDSLDLELKLSGRETL